MTPGSLAALQVDPPESLVLALMLRAEHVVSDYRTCSLTIECVLSCFALSMWSLSLSHAHTLSLFLSHAHSRAHTHIHTNTRVRARARTVTHTSPPPPIPPTLLPPSQVSDFNSQNIANCIWSFSALGIYPREPLMAALQLRARSLGNLLIL